MKNRNYTAEILVIACFIIGVLLAYYTSAQFNRWFFRMNSMVPGIDNEVMKMLLKTAATISGCLFISGIIYGRFLKRLR